MTYRIYTEGNGYTVWSIGLSGSRQDCYGVFYTLRTARNWIKRAYKLEEGR